MKFYFPQQTVCLHKALTSSLELQSTENKKFKFNDPYDVCLATSDLEHPGCMTSREASLTRSLFSVMKLSHLFLKNSTLARFAKSWIKVTLSRDNLSTSLWPQMFSKLFIEYLLVRRAIPSFNKSSTSRVATSPL